MLDEKTRKSLLRQIETIGLSAGRLEDNVYDMGYTETNAQFEEATRNFLDNLAHLTRQIENLGAETRELLPPHVRVVE